MGKTDLPNASQVSIRKGACYIFKDGINVIRFFAKNNGLEQVYFNDRLVSEQKNRIKLKVIHNFKHPNSKDYYEICLQNSIKRRETTGILLKNDEKISQITIKQNKSFMNRIRVIIYISGLFLIGCTFVKTFYQLHFSVLFIPLFPLFVGFYTLYASKIPFMTIEDTTDFIED